MLRVLLSVALSLPLTAFAAAEEHARLGDATISYDPAVWKMETIPSGTASMRFICIASDCPDRPAAYVLLTPANSVDLPDWTTTSPDTRPLNHPLLATPANHLSFAATRTPSPCRARVADTLSAVAVAGDTRYRFVTLPSFFCEPIPEMPEHHFFELLHGVATVPQ